MWLACVMRQARFRDVLDASMVVWSIANRAGPPVLKAPMVKREHGKVLICLKPWLPPQL